MRFEFATAAEIVFGAGTHRELPDRLAALGSRVFVITGQDPRRAHDILSPIGRRTVGAWTIGREPTLDDARAASAAARESGADMVLAVGGGSVIDLGKAVAALVTNPGDPLDYVEVVGQGRPLERRPIPLVAVPTTAGTGAEVTRNAVLASPADRVKVSLRSPLMLARLAVVDPELSRDLPPALTAATGMDALTQLLEPYVSVRATPLVDPLCLEGLRTIARSLPRAVADGDMGARTDMALGSLLGGLALANAGLGVVHGCAAVVGGRFEAPHGAVCAALLPGAVAVNMAALVARAPNGPALERYATLAGVLTGTADRAVLPDWIRDLRQRLGIPGLSAYGVTAADIPALAAATARASSTRANPIVLQDEELREILQDAL